MYRAVRERFWSLLGALLVIGLLLMGATAIIYFLAAISLMIGFAGAAILAGAPIWLKTIFSIGFFLVIVASAFMIFLLIYSRVVYVPQVMMVEGKGVFNSISRSFSLAGGELWRIAAFRCPIYSSPHFDPLVYSAFLREFTLSGLGIYVSLSATLFI